MLWQEARHRRQLINLCYILDKTIRINITVTISLENSISSVAKFGSIISFYWLNKRLSTGGVNAAGRILSDVY